MSLESRAKEIITQSQDDEMIQNKHKDHERD